MLGEDIRDAGLNKTGTIFNRSLQILEYADDIDLIGRRRYVIIDALKRLEEAASSIGLRINENKTKYMISSHRKPN